MPVNMLSVFDALLKLNGDLPCINLSGVAPLLSKWRNQRQVFTGAFKLPFSPCLFGFSCSDDLVESVDVYHRDLGKTPSEFGFLLSRADEHAPILVDAFVSFRDDPEQVGQIATPLVMTAAHDIRPAKELSDRERVTFDFLVGPALECRRVI